MLGTVTVVMIFSIPIVGIVTDHLQQQSKLKHNMLKGEIELEKLKHENYLLETEKLRLELDQMKLNSPGHESKVL